MKKSLLAMAILGTFSAAAVAQSNVVLYGLIDVGITHDNNGAATVNRMDSGIRSGSRWGLKSNEDLGSGLSAEFQLENGFGADDGTFGQGGLLFGRQAWLGLKGDFGAVRLGRQRNALYIAIADIIDPFNNGLAGDMAHTGKFLSGGFFNLDNSRMDNTLLYATPTIAGFYGQIGYGFGEVPGDTAGQAKLSALGTYANGPANVALAYHRANNASTPGGSNRTTLLGGTYDFGIVKAHAAYAWNKGDTSSATVLDSRDMMVGVSAPIGAGRLMASYVRKNNKLISDADANQIGIGYTHDLSKRTSLYASAARISNDANSAISYYGTGAKGSTDKLFDFGIRHTF